ncbi:hypothetical protein ACTL6U_03010 [Rhodovibrionaceae bacterium A322]
MRSYKSYMTTILITVIALGFFSLAVSLIIDPYGIHRLVSIEGINANKPEADTNIRLVKAYGVRLVRPNTIVLGNSRVEDGFDTDLFAEVLDVNVYNLGLPGSSIFELYRYLQHAQAVKPLQRVVLAVDYFSFNSNHGRYPPTFKNGRLSVQEDGQPTSFFNGERMEDLNNIYVSLSSMIKAWNTVIKQSRDNVSNRTVTGFNPMAEADLIYSRRGYRKNFFDKNYSQAKNIWRRGFSSEVTKLWPIAPFDYLQAIIDLCRKNNIQLDIFIHPYHAHMLELLQGLDQWEDFEDWKRHLVALVEADNARYPDKPEFPIWDFSNYNSITNDKLPEADDNSTGLKWYWEVSHYKSGVGDLVIQRMYGNDENRAEMEQLGSGPLPDDFGVKITLENLEEFLASYGPAREAYRQSRAEEMEELADVIARARKLKKLERR